MITITISPQQAQSLIWWARFDARSNTKDDCDPHLQEIADKVRHATALLTVAVAPEPAEQFDMSPVVGMVGNVVETPSCRTPRCVRTVKVRGLCQACYQRLHRLVNNSEGGVTWARLVEEGQCL